MNDELQSRFEGIDAPRPLPDDARRRIEALLVSAAPRPLPTEFRDRLETALVAGVGARPLPRDLRRRLERALVGSRLRTAGLIAAALLILLGSLALVTRGSDHGAPGSNLTASRQNGSKASGGGAGDIDQSGAPSSAGTATAPDSGGLAGGASAAASGTAAVQRTRVAVVGGDADEEAGFRAFAARTPRLALVAADAPAIVTVNLSAGPAKPTPGRVVMEGLAVSDTALRDEVFDVASGVERQAHIAAASAFPTMAPGRRAVIFTGSEEPFASVIPAALEEVLRQRGVAALRVSYGGSAHPVLPAADAAFLSLSPTDVRPWLGAAHDAGYAPGRGTWGVYSAADESLLAAVPPELHVVAPFTFADSKARDELAAATQRPLSARLIHGWLTARYLVEALSRSNADTPDKLAAALAALTGYDDGFAPAYTVRPGTNARTPEGIVLTVRGGRFVAANGFVRDTE